MPIYPGAEDVKGYKVISSYTHNEKVVISFIVNATVSDIDSYYRRVMAGDGWSYTEIGPTPRYVHNHQTVYAQVVGGFIVPHYEALPDGRTKVEMTQVTLESKKEEINQQDK